MPSPILVGDLGKSNKACPTVGFATKLYHRLNELEEESTGGISLLRKRVGLSIAKKLTWRFTDYLHCSGQSSNFLTHPPPPSLHTHTLYHSSSICIIQAQELGRGPEVLKLVCCLTRFQWAVRSRHGAGLRFTGWAGQKWQNNREMLLSPLQTLFQ